MNWSNIVASTLIVFAALVAFAGIEASIAILLQIIRQGGWKLAEPSVIKNRWRMIRPWMLAGAVLGLLVGMAIVWLERDQQPGPAAPPDIKTSPPMIQSKPRDASSEARAVE